MRQNFSNAIIKGSWSRRVEICIGVLRKFVEIRGESPNVLKKKFGTLTKMLLDQEHQCDGGFNISSSSNPDIDDNSKNNRNIPLAESYKDFDENLYDDANDYHPSIIEDLKFCFCKK